MNTNWTMTSQGDQDTHELNVDHGIKDVLGAVGGRARIQVYGDQVLGAWVDVTLDGRLHHGGRTRSFATLEQAKAACEKLLVKQGERQAKKAR